MGACADNLTTESHNAANPLGMSLRFCVHGSPIIHILIVVDVTLCSRQTGAVHLAHELFELSLELGVAILLLEVATYRNACGWKRRALGRWGKERALSTTQWTLLLRGRSTTTTCGSS